MLGQIDVSDGQRKRTTLRLRVLQVADFSPALHTIIKHQGEFTPLFERIVDVDDAKVIVNEGP